MTTIIAHGDGDGICAASLVKMVTEYQDAKVYFSHPMGIVHDLIHVRDDVIICDIAIDQREFKALKRKLQKIIENGYNVTYIDHHVKPGDLPPSAISIFNTKVSATELVYRYFYYKIPHNASRIALIGAINDYLDKTPLMTELMFQYERRTLFLDAGILAQGLKEYRRDYDKMRRLVEEFSRGMYPCEIPELVKKSLRLTRNDKYTQKEVIQHYKTKKYIAYIKNPQASRSKAAHWIMGDSGKVIGITILNHHHRKDVVDLTIRGRNKVDLRNFVPKIAKKMGGSGGGHANACGARIPKKKLDKFLTVLNGTIGALSIENGHSIENLVDLEHIIE